jgi:hypothetical protein
VRIEDVGNSTLETNLSSVTARSRDSIIFSGEVPMWTPKDAYPKNN